MALGRSSCSQLPGRCTSAPAASARAGGSTSCSRFDISGWRDRGLYPLVQGRRDARGELTASMTRGGGHFVFAQIGAARPARAADFPIERIPLRADRWRSGGRAVRSYRVAAHRRRPPAHGPGGSTSCSRFDISGWRDRGLYPLVQGRRDARGESTASMTRGGGHFVFAQIGAARPARAADFPVE